ncbi:MAG: alpha/beta hydrolase [Candidatus Eisenbacteria bacterium]|uniref:Alpha/beta hydrolase n=1 Tax=Eiseniibacteriota bacterium TaxID=2212470 RepID=A0A7Y2H2H8_UNCEI|nr:alpha/beta hydrolase [Candidatus Eisenbacteria bacterium]
MAEFKFEATSSSGEVSAILERPRGAKALYVFAHGAGAPMNHHFMETMAEKFAKQKIATLRFNFPYIELGRRAPSPQPILKKTIRSAVAVARKKTQGKLPIFAGGKSMGGRMTSLAQSEEPIEHVQGLIFVGFPLHAPGRDSADRGEHLKEVKLPMLFLQGMRDKLANLDFLEPLHKSLGRRSKLHKIEWADHGFHVPKKSGRDDDDIMTELASVTSDWIDRKLP